MMSSKAENSNRKDKFWEKEVSLIKELKKLCDGKGKEINVKESAKILHKLGLLYYERSPDKLSLIRSAALLNAAIIRKPSNVEDIMKDIKQVHLHLLKISKAKHPKFNLGLLSKFVRILVDCMRDESRSVVSGLQNISDVEPQKLLQLEKEKIKVVKNLQEKITAQYANIMKFISDWCIQAMGEPPCKYALVGMGSLARKEITPYSDFEHIIVLEDGIFAKYRKDSKKYQSILEYFRWYSVLFQMVVIELGETVLPCVAIPSLNHPGKERGKNKDNWFYDDCAVNGISFDGMQFHACKSPLGRAEGTETKPWITELIRPIREMVKYLDTEEDLKNGYKLASIFTATCFVSGDEKIYKIFSNLVQKRIQEINEHDKSARHIFITQLEEDIENFDTMSKLEVMFAVSNFNLKRVIYRSMTILIAAFGRLCPIYPSSSYDIINFFEVKKAIKSKVAHELAYAVSVACELRIKVYCCKGRQDDFVQTPDCFDSSTHSPAADLIEIIGEKSLVDYFVIAWNLQNLIRGNQYAIRGNNLHMEVYILNLLRMFQRIVDKWRQMVAKDQTHELNMIDRFTIATSLINTKKFQESLDLLRSLLPQTDEEKLKININSTIGQVLTDMNRIEDACEHFSKVIKNLPDPPQTQDVSHVYYQYGKCLHKKKDFQEALTQFEHSLEYFNSTKYKIAMSQIHSQYYKTWCLVYIGQCLYGMGKIEEAKVKAKKCLELHEEFGINNMRLLKDAYQLLGDCLYKEGKYSEAKVNFEKELELHKKDVFASNSSKARRLMQSAQHKIAWCSMYQEISNYPALLHFVKQMLGAE